MNILLPIETINREIDFKIILAGLLSGQGHKIYIGQHDFLMSLLDRMNGGLYIGKNIFHKRADDEDGERYFKLKERGFDIVYLHEEGAVFFGDQEQWRQTLSRQYNPAIFDGEDRLCVWGEFQRQFDVQRVHKVPVKVVGHPRFDLYKDGFRPYYNQDLQAIKSKFSNYVLINGNYGWANHGKGLKGIFPDSLKQNVEERLLRIRYFTHFTGQMTAMVELIHILAVKFPDISFVFRPHPSEDHEYYKILFRGVPNIFVIHDGPVNPWIIGAMALIHDGCTTAIEANISGIPVINFKPFYDQTCDIWLPNSMGVKSSTVEEVVYWINNLDELASAGISKLDPLAENLLFNFGNDSYSALLSIIKEKLNDKNGTDVKFPNSFNIKLKNTQIKAKIATQHIFQPQKLNSLRYHQIKFYGFDPLIMSNKIIRMEILLRLKVSWTYHNQNLITIDK